MKKADYKFHRDKKEQIQNQSKQSEEPVYFFKQAANSPIFIPKRKKKK
jgi:hypothetical protein